ncbi:MAG: PEP-CTERM sorting domain-containing protein [Verrucomicrobia bacterium]|nr:PEP-CTERM sorting domain-containing protein [Verrucomicrobiota bacterium]
MSLGSACQLSGRVVMNVTGGTSILQGGFLMNPLSVPGGQSSNPSFTILGNVLTPAGARTEFRGASFVDVQGRWEIGAGALVEQVMRFVHSGTVAVDGGSLLVTVPRSALGVGVWDSTGTWSIGENASIDARVYAYNGNSSAPFADPFAYMVNSGTIDVHATNYTFSRLTGLAINSGTLQVRNAGQLTTGRALDSTGVIRLREGGGLSLGGALTQRGGVIEFSDGFLSAAQATLTGATLRGVGSITAPLLRLAANGPQRAQLEPGSAAGFGQIQVTGNLELDGAVLALGLFRDANGQLFADGLTVSGTASLLNVELALRLRAGSGVLQEGDQVRLLSAAQGLLAGGPISITTDGSLGGLGFLATPNGTDPLLTVIPEPSTVGLLAASGWLALGSTWLRRRQKWHARRRAKDFARRR